MADNSMTGAERVEIDALKPGQMGRRYRVGTFRHVRRTGTSYYTAYTRDYNPRWSGCIEFDVIAASGREAKRVAAQARKKMEEPDE